MTFSRVVLAGWLRGQMREGSGVGSKIFALILFEGQSDSVEFIGLERD